MVNGTVMALAVAVSFAAGSGAAVIAMSVVTHTTVACQPEIATPAMKHFSEWKDEPTTGGKKW
jgi:hypothetical protein